MSKEKKAGKKIERTPAEVEAINKAVDAKRETDEPAIKVTLEGDRETEPATKKERIALLEAYKAQNPTKFEAKGLDKELKKLKK